MNSIEFISYIHLLNVKIHRFFWKILYGNKVTIGKSMMFRNNFSLRVMENGKINIGDKVFFNNSCSVNAYCSITIGGNTIFGEGVRLYDHNHGYSDINSPIISQGYTVAPIVIGKNCWIGSNVVILKGVNIGDNCIIGAGCIIYKNVPNNTIVINHQQLDYKNRS